MVWIFFTIELFNKLFDIMFKYINQFYYFENYAKSSWDKLRILGVVVNEYDRIKSLKWIKNMSKDKNYKLVFANHNPSIKLMVIRL